MIRGVFYDGAKNHRLFEVGVKGYEVETCVCDYGLNSVDGCKLALPASNKVRDVFRSRSPVVSLIDETGEVFRGSVSSRPKYDARGNLVVDLDGALGWLDTRVKAPFTVSGTHTIESYVSALISQYLETSESMKYVVEGVLAHNGGRVYIDHAEEYTTYLDLLSELVKLYKGYFYTRYDGDHPQIDFVLNPYAYSDMKIEYGINLESLEDSLDFSDYASRIYATGKNGLTLSGGYAVNANAEAQYGRVDRAIKTNAETTAELTALANAELAIASVPIRTIEITARDLLRSGYSVNRLSVGTVIRATDANISLDTSLIVQNARIDYITRSKSKFTLGKSPVNLVSLLPKTR